MWASIRAIDPQRFERFASVEELLEAEKEALQGEIKREAAKGKLKGEELDKAERAVKNRIPLIEKGRPLRQRTEPRWRRMKRDEKKLYEAGELDMDVRGTGKGLEVWDPAEPFPQLRNLRLVRIALSHEWTESPIEDPWRLPAGAFGEASGPI